jgi:hypothetical protein
MKKILLATVLAGLTGTAMAAPVDFTFVAYGGFVQGTNTGFQPVTSTQGCQADGADTICTSFVWGNPTGTLGPFAGQSGASINTGDNQASVGLTPAQLATVGQNIFSGDDQNGWDSTFGQFGTLTHWNRDLQTAQGPAAIDVRYVLDLYDGATLVQTLRSDDLVNDFVVSFTETANVAGSCPPNSVSVCDDIFTFATGNGQAPTTSFVYQDYKYTVSLVGFCTDPNNVPGSCPQDGILLTQEGSDTVGYVFEFKGAEKVVPVPGALALVGLGLAGMGFARRRAAK